MDASKWTPERREAFVRVVAAARAFVRAVDEFGEDDPSATAERHEELINALDAEGRVWDEGSDDPLTLACELSDSATAHDGRTVREG